MALTRTIVEERGSVSPALFTPRALLLGWSALMVSAIVAAPWLASGRRPEGWILYSAFETLCHQQAQRSWHIDGMPLAVCVRCCGFYAGILTAALVNLRLPVKMLALALGSMSAAWAVEFFGLGAPSDEFRFLTGLAVGVTACAAALYALSER